MTKCNQEGCNNPAAYRFTWPGKAEAGICGQHVQKLVQVAEAMGLPLEVIPLQHIGFMPDEKE
jgi:hypothetical protein